MPSTSGFETSSATKPKRSSEPCRAIRVKGGVVAGANPLKQGSTLDGKTWLTLARDGEIVIRHAATSREYALSGPAQALPCRSGQEEVVLARGSLRAAPGGGARPGAMVLVASPFGTASYGNANLTVRATSQGTNVHVDSGTVWLQATTGAEVIGEARLVGPEAKAHLARTPTYRVEATVAACEASATAAEMYARQLIEQEYDSGIGSGAATHLQLRVTARQACRVAEAAAQLAGEPARTLALVQRVLAANSRWRSVPLGQSSELK